MFITNWMKINKWNPWTTIIHDTNCFINDYATILSPNVYLKLFIFAQSNCKKVSAIELTQMC